MARLGITVAVATCLTASAYKLDQQNDWLLKTATNSLASSLVEADCSLTLSNSLISRTFAVPGESCQAPNLYTLDYTDSAGASVLAAFDVEASVTLNDQVWDVGGLAYDCVTRDMYDSCTYLNRTTPKYVTPQLNESAWQFDSYTSDVIKRKIDYDFVRGTVDGDWPPAGVHLKVSSTPGLAPS